jgi:hypothetical protein
MYMEPEVIVAEVRSAHIACAFSSIYAARMTL